MTEEKRYSILFVDDERRVLNSLKRGLMGEPYRIILALSGKEALEILENEPVAVIVSDMKMPEMNGLELLQLVAQRFPDVIRLVLSGYSHTSTVLAAVNEGRIFRYITKPWSIDNDIKPALEDAVKLYQLRKQERNETENLKVAVTDSQKKVSQTKKIASELLLRKADAQTQAMERVKNIFNYIFNQAINLEMGELDDESRKLVSEIRRTCRQSLDGLEKVTLLNNLETGKRLLAQKVFEPSAFVNGLEGVCGDLNRTAEVEIVFQTEGDVVPERVFGDEDLLRVMTYELLENAVQNSPPGGKVVCRFAWRMLEPGSFQLRVTVLDEGPGIAKERLRELQRPFVCGEERKKLPVWGVGLSLVRLIATKLHATLTIAKGETGGSQAGFEIRLRGACTQ
ncbi:MAG: response regulator [Deltaproteobacteria bacterium]|nr:response regulator [Deltaproteobacteria bacterium]